MLNVVAVERRRRYVPVKTTADLMLIQSDIFTVKHGQLIVSEDRMNQPLPLIKLGKAFVNIDDFHKHMRNHRPNICELEHLTIAGDVYIGNNVTLKGTVIIIAVDGSVIMIPDGSVLVDKVVTGNLRILDH
jgi:UTP--glucose-1-phosphate uridylyltransferase